MTSSFPPPTGGFPAPPPEPGLPPTLTSQVPVPMAPAPYVFQGAAAGQPPSPAHRMKRSGLEIASIVLTVVALIVAAACLGVPAVQGYGNEYGFLYYGLVPILLAIGLIMLIRRRPTSMVLAAALPLLTLVRELFWLYTGAIYLFLMMASLCVVGFITCFAGARMFNGRPVSVSCGLAVAEALGAYALWQTIGMIIHVSYWTDSCFEIWFNLVSGCNVIYYESFIDYPIILLFLVIVIVASTLSVVVGLLKRSRVLMIVAAAGASFFVVVSTFYYFILILFHSGFVMEIFMEAVIVSAALFALALMPLRRSAADWFAGRWEPRVRQPASHQVAFVAAPVAGQYPGGQPAPVVGAPVSPQVAALLPSTAPTFWISFFFGLFGLIPMSMANSMAARLGAVTNQYNHAFLKGWLIGMAAWIACYVLVFVLIMSSGY